MESPQRPNFLVVRLAEVVFIPYICQGDPRSVNAAPKESREVTSRENAAMVHSRQLGRRQCNQPLARSLLAILSTAAQAGGVRSPTCACVPPETAACIGTSMIPYSNQVGI